MQRTLRLLLNALIVSGAIVIVVLGLPALAPASQDQTQVGTPVETLATPVRLRSLTIEDQIVVQRQFLGRLEARRSANIGFEFGGTIEKISAREGGKVRKGDVLASLNTDALVVARQAARASLNAAKAQFDFSEAEATRIERLVSRGAAQRNRLEQVEAERDTRAAQLAESESAVVQAELRLRKSRLIAPFDGIVGAKSANLGETVAPGQPIVSVFESGGADFRVGLPTTLQPEELENTRVRVNGEDYPVALRTIRPDIDFRTNTRTAIFEVVTEELNSFGLSATLFGDVTLAIRGAWVPVDAMRPSAEGYWIVLAVDDDMVAQRIAVEILHQRQSDAFVIGAFETGTMIISDGAHKVVPGQRVRVE